VYELPIPQIRISEHAIRWSRADLVAWLAQRREAS
jgi:predicted DNA-binding transcriptional regulator AlpA